MIRLLFKNKRKRLLTYSNIIMMYMMNKSLIIIKKI